MTTGEARIWIVKTSLMTTTGLFVFVLIAPLFGYRLPDDGPSRILEIVLPTLAGYLASATHYVFSSHADSKDVEIPNASLVSILIRGSTFAWILMLIAALFGFGWSNRAAATPGTGTNIDDLTKLITASLVLLSSTTGIAVSYLFALDKKAAAAIAPDSEQAEMVQ